MGGVGKERVWGLLHTRFVLHQNSGAPIRLLYLQLMHSFWFSNFARVLNSQSSRDMASQADEMVSQDLEQVFFQMGWPSVKPEQAEVVKTILKRDVFVILPTGFGKSACYQCLPLLHQKLQPDCDPSIVVVVTPLKALMKDQVRLLRTDQSQLSNLIKLNNTGISTL